MDIETWLKLIGFPEYLDLFRRITIDMEILSMIKASQPACRFDSLIACLLLT